MQNMDSQRRNSLGVHISKADIAYKKKDPAKLKMEEFVNDT